MSTVPALFRGLVDDAALFPPGNAPMPRAVAEHRHHRAAPYADLVGRFLCPVSRFEELRVELGDGPTLEIGLIADTGPVGFAASAPSVLAEPRVELRSVECAVPAGADLVDGVRSVAAALVHAVPADHWFQCFIEIPRQAGWREALGEIERWGWETRVVGAKLRTGGLTTEAFPSDRELADFITECMRLDLPFKLTAGLHRAVRHTAPTNGFEHHGYLNALAAVCSGLDPAARQDDLVGLVAERRARRLLAIVWPLLDAPGESSESRTWFWSYGSCSIAEPLEDLVALGVLDADLLQYLPATVSEEHA
jgi:hypothetical protein